jgi:hypothetical protein
LANADHLYGLSAECGLKQLMVKFGMPVRGDGTPTDKQDRVHANEVWQRYQAYASGPAIAHYQLPPINPFSNWRVEQRYFPQSLFSQLTVDSHKIGALQVRGLINRARLDGILP